MPYARCELENCKFSVSRPAIGQLKDSSVLNCQQVSTLAPLMPINVDLVEINDQQMQRKGVLL